MTIGTFENNGNRQISTGIDGVDDNDIVLETGDVSAFRFHQLRMVAGFIDVDPSLDGINYVATIALQTDNDLDADNRVNGFGSTTEGRFEGNYKSIRVRQFAGGPTTGVVLTSYKVKP